MANIILISCASTKCQYKTEAQNMYISPLFVKSLRYAKNKLKSDIIFILSAKYGLLDLIDVIEPYNVTLCYVPKEKRKPDLKILTSEEKKDWGKKVLDTLSKQADLQNDEFIVLAGEEYIKPIEKGIKHLKNLLKGKSQGKRLQWLKEELNE